MRALPVASILVLLSAVFAGCSDAPEADADSLAEAERAAAELQVKATETTGVIRGFVVDGAIRPLGGALVLLANTDKNTTTSAEGAFAFEGLEAGTYFLTASLEDYATVQQSVEVVAGVSNPEAVRVLLAEIPRGEPSITSVQAIIYVSGSGWVSAPDPVGENGVTVGGGGVLGDGGNWQFEVEIPVNGTVAQTELVWDMTTALGAEGRGSGGAYDDNDGVDTATYAGPSPLVMRANATEGTDTANNVYYSFYAWPSSGLPVGFQFNQKVDAYVNVFYNFRPDDGWSFVADGPHSVPS